MVDYLLGHLRFIILACTLVVALICLLITSVVFLYPKKGRLQWSFTVFMFSLFTLVMVNGFFRVLLRRFILDGVGLFFWVLPIFAGLYFAVVLLRTVIAERKCLQTGACDLDLETKAGLPISPLPPIDPGGV